MIETLQASQIVENIKSIIGLVILSFGLGQWLFADCGEGRFVVWPYGNTLFPDQQIMLEGGWRKDEIINSIGKDCAACLWSGNDPVELRVVEIHDRRGGKQAILKPARKLVVGRTYQFVLEKTNPSANEKPLFSPQQKWKIIEKAADTQLKWNSPPQESGKYWMHYGCGDDEWVAFNIDVTMAKMLRLKAQVRPVTSRHWATCYLPLEGKEIKIGHGMCGGDFNFQDSLTYEVKFSIVDPAGKLIPQPWPAVKFSPPTSGDFNSRLSSF